MEQKQIDLLTSSLSSSPAKRILSATLVTSPNFTSNFIKLKVRGSNAFDDLTLQIYSYESVGTGVPSHRECIAIFQEKSKPRGFWVLPRHN